MTEIENVVTHERERTARLLEAHRQGHVTQAELVAELSLSFRLTMWWLCRLAPAFFSYSNSLPPCPSGRPERCKFL